MQKSPIEYLRHILDETDFLIEQTSGLSADTFLGSTVLKRAFVRSLEVIGEATKHLPPHIRQKYPDVDWREMAGMRDQLIHGYINIDHEIVWNVVVNDIPALRRQLQQIIENEGLSGED
jgi:uncharacterized protein with HEPN domain